VWLHGALPFSPCEAPTLTFGAHLMCSREKIILQIRFCPFDIQKVPEAQKYAKNRDSFSVKL
jgi:hypothetical protein